VHGFATRDAAARVMTGKMWRARREYAPLNRRGQRVDGRQGEMPETGVAAIFSSIPRGTTLPTEGRQGAGRRDGLDWWPAKGPRRPPGPGPPRTLPARSSPRLSSAPTQDDVEGPATDSTPGLGPRARPRGDPDTFGRCGHRDHLSDHRDASLARMSQGGWTGLDSASLESQIRSSRQSNDPGRATGVELPSAPARRPGWRTSQRGASEMVKMAAGWVTTSGAGLTAVLTVRRRQRAGHGAAAAWAAQRTWLSWPGHETAGPHAGVRHAPAFRAADHGQVPR